MPITRKYHKEILQIALPSILSNITVPLLGVADLAIAGHLGAASYIGAIAIGSAIFNMIYWVFSFLRMGTSGMTSQAYGAGDMAEVQHLLYRSLVTSAGIVAVVLLLQRLLLRFALFVMSPTDVVTGSVEEYFNICIWGAPAVLGLYSITGWFIGLQNARFPLYVAIVQNLANISASLFFVFVLRLDITGIALGTLAAQYCGLFLALFYMHRLQCRLRLPRAFSRPAIFRKNAIRRFFTVNRDIFLRTLCLVCVTLYFTSAGARQGDSILAANALLMQFFTLYSYFMDGFAFAGEALSGKCAGARDFRALRVTVKALFLWGLGVAVAFTLIYAAAGQGLLRLLTDELSVVATATTYLPWAVLIPFAGLAAFVWDGVFIGLTATRQMLQSMCSATLTFFISFLALFPLWHNHALWLSLLLYLSMRGIMQHWLYKNKILPFHAHKPIKSRQK